MTRRREWYHFWPDRPTGTLRVDFTNFRQKPDKICYVYIFALRLSVSDKHIGLCLFMFMQNLPFKIEWIYNHMNIVGQGVVSKVKGRLSP